MNSEFVDVEQTNSLIDVILFPGTVPAPVPPDSLLVHAITDLAMWGSILPQQTAHRDGSSVSDTAAPLSPARRKHPYRKAPLSSRPARIAAVILLVLGLGIGTWVTPPVQAKLTAVACVIPGLGIRACDSPGLIAPESVTAERGGTIVTVTTVLSAGGETTVRLTITGIPGIPNDRQTVIFLEDDRGRTYLLLRAAHGSSSSVNAPTQTYSGEWTFAPLAPNVRTVHIRIDSPLPVGEWSVPVLVVPVAQAQLTSAQASTASMTVQGITVQVTHVAATADRTVFAIHAQAQTPTHIIHSLDDPIHFNRTLILRDDRGTVYRELSTQGKTWPNQGGGYTDGAQFPVLLPGAHTVTLVIPYVEVAETGEATVKIPVAGLQPPTPGVADSGDRHALNIPVTIGAYRFRLTGVSIASMGGEQSLAFDVDLGDWQGSRKLVEPGTPHLTSTQPMGYSASDAEVNGFRQVTQVRIPLPPTLGDTVDVQFTQPVVAVQGPWQLTVPVSSGDTDRAGADGSARF